MKPSLPTLRLAALVALISGLSGCQKIQRVEDSPDGKLRARMTIMRGGIGGDISWVSLEEKETGRADEIFHCSDGIVRKIEWRDRRNLVITAICNTDYNRVQVPMYLGINIHYRYEVQSRLSPDYKFAVTVFVSSGTGDNAGRVEVQVAEIEHYRNVRTVFECRSGTLPSVDWKAARSVRITADCPAAKIIVRKDSELGVAFTYSAGGRSRGLP